MENRKYNAVILRGNADLALEQVSQGLLHADHCRVKIKNVGVCSSDIHRAFSSGAYHYPLVMGHEMAGEIVAVGSNVKEVYVSDRVVIYPLIPCKSCDSCLNQKYQQCVKYGYYGSRCDGGYAEFLDVFEWNLIKIDDKVDFKDAAAVEPLSVVIHALKRLSLFDEKYIGNIAIIGAGFLGLLMVQILRQKSSNANITLIDRNEFKLNVGKKYVNSAHLLVNSKEWVDYIQSNSNKFDITVEATGAPDAFIKAIEMTKPNGKVLWMGNITDNLEMPKAVVSSILRKELQILGTWNSSFRSDISDDWNDAVKVMEEGIKPSELVTQWITLADVPETLQRFYKHKMKLDQFDSIKAMVNV